MKVWLAQLALPVLAWVPLGLSATSPVVIAAVILPLSRRRGRGVATALALRTVLVLAFGFAAIAAVASVALVQTGLRELRERELSAVRALAEQVESGPLGLSAGDTQLKLTLFRAKEKDAAFVAAGTDACRSMCLLSFAERSFDARELKARLTDAWTTNPENQNVIAIGGRPYLLVASAVRDASGKPRSGVVAGIDASSIAEEAARTTWLLIALSYALLVVVGWTTWKQVSRSLAKRIRQMHAQLREGVVDESTHENLEVDGHELRELADSVSAYIKRSLAEKSTSEERHRRLAELSPDAVLMCSDRRIRSANAAAIALAGAKHRSDLVASSIDKFLQFDDANAVDGLGALRPATWRRLDGRLLHVEVAQSSDSIGDEIVRQFVVRDVTSRRLREAELAHRAEHDSLTGLVNRARFEARLREMLDPSAPTRSKFGEGREVAVAFVDLDGFKPVNDTFGHAAGDAVLVTVAERLRESTRGSDLIARLGGDEFAVLLEIQESSQLVPVAQRILRALREPIPHDGRMLSIGASLGLASTRPLDSRLGGRTLNAAQLVNAADEAMYAAKTAGGNRFTIAAGARQSTEDRADVRFRAVV